MAQGYYYVPEQSKLPILMSMCVLILAAGAGTVIVFGSIFGILLLSLGMLAFLIMLAVWFAQVHYENTQGLYGPMLHRSYIWAMAWFICSEVFFFATFFGILFYMRSFVVPWLGGEGDKGISNILWQGFEAGWPLMENPDNSKFLAPHGNMAWPGFSALAGWLPLWNTLILVSSSVTCTIAHHGVEHDNRKKTILWLAITVALAVTFLFIQAYEYIHAYQDLGLTLNSGIYGTTFFMLTGFHGAHVTLGTIMLGTMLARAIKGHFSADNHFGFRATAWYWHFVDVVWVLLFIFVYIL